MRVLKPKFTIIPHMSWEQAVRFIEMCGRTCYKSEDLITEDSAVAFVRRIIDSGHHSVIEHVVFTVVFIVDRGITHELVRHRITSPSQESTRYCNYSKGKFDSQISVIDLRQGIELDKKTSKLSLKTKQKLLDIWVSAMKDAERHYMAMINLGASPQIARSVLPQSTKAEIVITANIREWRHILKERTSKAAHPQMREVMVPLLVELRRQCPTLFGDIYLDIDTATALQLEIDGRLYD